MLHSHTQNTLSESIILIYISARAQPNDIDGMKKNFVAHTYTPKPTHTRMTVCALSAGTIRIHSCN